MPTQIGHVWFLVLLGIASSERIDVQPTLELELEHVDTVEGTTIRACPHDMYFRGQSGMVTITRLVDKCSDVTSRRIYGKVQCKDYFTYMTKYNMAGSRSIVPGKYKLCQEPDDWEATQSCTSKRKKTGPAESKGKYLECEYKTCQSTGNKCGFGHFQDRDGLDAISVGDAVGDTKRDLCCDKKCSWYGDGACEYKIRHDVKLGTSEKDCCISLHESCCKSSEDGGEADSTRGPEYTAQGAKIRGVSCCAGSNTNSMCKSLKGVGAGDFYMSCLWKQRNACKNYKCTPENFENEDLL